MGPFITEITTTKICESSWLLQHSLVWNETSKYSPFGEFTRLSGEFVSTNNRTIFTTDKNFLWWNFQFQYCYRWWNSQKLTTKFPPNKPFSRTQLHLILSRQCDKESHKIVPFCHSCEQEIPLNLIIADVSRRIRIL